MIYWHIILPEMRNNNTVTKLIKTKFGGQYDNSQNKISSMDELWKALLSIKSNANVPDEIAKQIHKQNLRGFNFI